MTDAERELDIRAIFDAYGAAFDDADAEGVTELFAWPSVIWQLGDGHVFDDAEDLGENVEALLGVFVEAGIVLTTPTILELRIGDGAAFATVAWRQENSAGEPLHEFTCHYMLVDDSGTWRIATVVNAPDSVTH